MRQVFQRHVRLDGRRCAEKSLPLQEFLVFAQQQLQAMGHLAQFLLSLHLPQGKSCEALLVQRPINLAFHKRQCVC